MENQKSVLAMLAVGALILGGILGYVIRGGSEASEVDTHEMAHVSSSNDKELELHLNMRKLWADHVIWTREYVVSAIDGTADVGQDAARLMKNQEEIGAAKSVCRRRRVEFSKNQSRGIRFAYGICKHKALKVWEGSGSPVGKHGERSLGNNRGTLFCSGLSLGPDRKGGGNWLQRRKCL